MKQYLDKMNTLSLEQTMLKSSKVLLFLSGSSHLESASLTAGQLEFLDQKYKLLYKFHLDIVP